MQAGRVFLPGTKVSLFEFNGRIGVDELEGVTVTAAAAVARGLVRRSYAALDTGIEDRGGFRKLDSVDKRSATTMAAWKNHAVVE